MELDSRRRLWGVPLILLTVALLKGSALSSLFFTNMGLLSLVPAFCGIEAAQCAAPVSQETIGWFERALRAWPENQQARWYLSLAHFLGQDEARAADVWPDSSPYSPDAFELGKSAKAAERIDAALFWFAVGSHFEDAAGDRSLIALGRLCQRQYAFQSALLPRSQRLCEPYWYPADRNLLINGQFDRGLAGWVDLIASDESGVVYSVEETTGSQGPCLKIVGKREGYHGGKFQSLTLRPGTTLSYKVRLKTDRIDHLAIDVLVWQAGRVEKRLMRVSGSRDWEVFESSVVIPDGGDWRVIFAPVRIWGKGTVWLDDVRLAIAEGKQP